MAGNTAAVLTPSSTVRRHRHRNGLRYRRTVDESV